MGLFGNGSRESVKIGLRWNSFLIECQRSKDAASYLLNYMIVLLASIGTQNNKSFEEMLDILRETHKEGIWRSFTEEKFESWKESKEVEKSDINTRTEGSTSSEHNERDNVGEQDKRSSEQEEHSGRPE